MNIWKNGEFMKSINIRHNEPIKYLKIIQNKILTKNHSGDVIIWDIDSSSKKRNFSVIWRNHSWENYSDIENEIIYNDDNFTLTYWDIPINKCVKILR